MQGLFRRGGVWHARLVIPLRLRGSVGRRELVRSTRCSDLAKAKVVGSELIAGWRRCLHEIDRGSMTDEEVRKLLRGSPELAIAEHVTLDEASAQLGIPAKVILHEVEAGRVQLWNRVSSTSGVGYETSIQNLIDAEGIPYNLPLDAQHTEAGGRVLRLLEEQLVAQDALSSSQGGVHVNAYQLAEGRAYVPDTVASSIISINQLMVPGVQLQSLRQKLLRELTPQEAARVRQPFAGISHTALPMSSWANRTLREAVDAYLTDPDALQGRTQSPKEIAQHTRLLGRFVDFLQNKQLGQVTDDDLRKFRDWVCTWPAGNLPKTLKRSTWQEEIDAAKSANWPVMTAGASMERVHWVRQFFAWLFKYGRTPMKIGDSLAGETGKTKAEQVEAARGRALIERKSGAVIGGDGKKRFPFSREQLAAIFNQEQFKTGHGLHKATGRARCDPNEYWVPLLSLLHGMRVREVTQLSLDCIFESEGVWCININALAADRSVKVTTKGEAQVIERTVPVHPLAIKLGLLQYRDALRRAGYRRLFPDLRWSSQDDGYTKEVGRKFTELKKQLGFGKEVSFHSFRHTANNAYGRVVLPGMDAGLQKYVRYAITGHSLPAEDVNSTNYTNATLQEKSLLIANTVFDGLPEIASFDIGWGVQAIRRALDTQQGIEQNGPVTLAR